MGIDLDAPEPLYEQMAAIVRARIQDGTYERRVPSGPTPAREFGLALPTVQRALQLLKDEGLVRAVVGRGTFVVRPVAPNQENPSG
ncbi:GntR family transcriptional regulator [Actinomadura rubrisoli]|uniref:GntR family transcriptional regulator n=1 Tax=Actinomadura rubrisoli TaxID=2530368 RepID=A0A4R5AVM3_9ACTN|nr:GntR family transcriptional regulator [Actinomadura rubrisoli]TDD76160.1 GntR family transcriptional regulator [Actinomadura rubrisoli]